MIVVELLRETLSLSVSSILARPDELASCESTQWSTENAAIAMACLCGPSAPESCCWSSEGPSNTAHFLRREDLWHLPTYIDILWMVAKSCATLDGWNPLNNGMFTTYQLVQDFFHSISTIDISPQDSRPPLLLTWWPPSHRPAIPIRGRDCHIQWPAKVLDCSRDSLQTNKTPIWLILSTRQKSTIFWWFSWVSPEPLRPAEHHMQPYETFHSGQLPLWHRTESPQIQN